MPRFVQGCSSPFDVGMQVPILQSSQSFLLQGRLSLDDIQVGHEQFSLG